MPIPSSHPKPRRIPLGLKISDAGFLAVVIWVGIAAAAITQILLSGVFLLLVRWRKQTSL